MRLLQYGARGDDVKRVQRTLHVTADGIFGKQTRAAVVAFQRRRRLEADGVVGPKTLAALFPKPKAPAKRPSSPHTPGPRRRALAWLEAHDGITEDPPGTNKDRRKDGITAAQILVAGGGTWLVGQPWCGVWCAAAALHAGLKIPSPHRWASVARIEDDARAGRNGFRGWTTDPRNLDPRGGELAVLFGRGIHVATVISVDLERGLIRTREGNTASGAAGSQSNGGGAFTRIRSLRDVRGFALVDYPQH